MSATKGWPPFRLFQDDMSVLLRPCTGMQFIGETCMTADKFSFQRAAYRQPHLMSSLEISNSACETHDIKIPNLPQYGPHSSDQCCDVQGANLQSHSFCLHPPCHCFFEATSTELSGTPSRQPGLRQNTLGSLYPHRFPSLEPRDRHESSNTRSHCRGEYIAPNP